MEKFSKMKGPAIIDSIRMETKEQAIKEIERAQTLGAQGFLLHIQFMDKKYRNAQDIKEIISHADKPVMALNYRKDGEYNDHDKLSTLLLEAVDNGASAVDMWCDMFDYDSISSLAGCDKPFAKKKPKEVSMRKEVIEKQKQFIKRVHDKGAEVLVSAHIGVELSVEEGVSLAKEIESRGADIVKIISNCNTPEQALTILRTDVELRKELKVPYLYQCGGKYGRLVRYIAPLFGSKMALCHSEYGSVTNHEKPLIADVMKVYDVIKWRIDEDESGIS